MRTYSLLTCLLVALVVAGCDVGTLVDPADSTATAEVAGKAPKMVPIKGDATFAVDLNVDPPPVLFCGDGEIFFKRFTGEGINSHLGAGLFVGMSDECWVDGDDLAVTGTSKFIAANGDELWVLWGIKGVAGANAGVVEWSFHEYAGDYPLEFTGGTGRFEGAHGYAVGRGTFDYDTLTGTYWFDGVVSSVGSSK